MYSFDTVLLQKLTIIFYKIQFIYCVHKKCRQCYRDVKAY